MDFLKSNWKLISIFLTIILVVLMVLYVILALIAKVISWFGAFLILFVAFFLLARKIAKFLVFPGHCSFFKRSIEYRLAKHMASQVVGQILDQRYSLELLN